MLNDQQASELLSKSLHGALTRQQTAEIDEHLATSDTSQAFLRLCKVIHQSLSDIAVMSEDGHEGIAPGLSSEARSRLRDSVARESRRARITTRVDSEPESRIQLNPDTAMVLAVLRSELLGEETLDELLSQWTPTKPGSLGQFLHEQGAISSGQLSEMEQAAASLLSAQAMGDDINFELALDVSKSRVFEQVRRVSTTAGAATTDPREARQLVSRFTLLRQLGQGGLGTVWLARDEKLKRTVAIKEITGDAVASQQAAHRFVREAEITGYLEHPNVVPLYQFGTDPKTGYPFYAMRFVGKRTLADAIQEYHERRKSGQTDAIELHRLLTAFLGVSQAIAYAHSRGVIHRDLKPENIALDNFGQVIVLDWGLAKLTEQAEFATRLQDHQEIDESYLTRTLAGEVVGTPLYMAPEQAAGDLDDIDERTDVYGLGAILFAILTGYAPHESSCKIPRQTADLKELLKVIAEKEPPSARALNPAIATDLDRICRQAMSKKRYARHAGASELAHEVERWMAGQNEKQANYNQMRLEGRELQASLQSSIRDLGTNARFMANLPPIQELIDIRLHDGAEDESSWRDRLAVIFNGLLHANRDFVTVGFCTVNETETREIVRVERHSTDGANIRSVPLSRLVHEPIDDFSQNVMKQKPDEVFVDLHGNRCDSRPGLADEETRLCAGVPVFDARTEEPFGYVWIESDFRRVLDSNLRNRITVAQQVLVIDHDARIWIHETRAAGRIESNCGQPASEYCSGLGEIVERLQRQQEYICQTDRQVYASRVELAPRRAGLIFVLTQAAYKPKS